MCAPTDIAWLNALGVSSTSEIGVHLTTHHIAADMLVGRLVKRAQEAEG